MIKFLLDTDTCSYAMRRSRSHTALLARLRAHPLAEQAVSVVTAAELLFGTKLATARAKATDDYQRFIRHLAVLEWGADAAEHYADIRADLQRKGTPIGANDLLIAAHARSLGVTLVTNNVREFARVKGLKVDNWFR